MTIIPFNDQKGPYKLVAKFHAGHEHIVAAGHNILEVREAHTKVSRNPVAIESIELRDSEGVLETIWRASWIKRHSYPF